ncbi:MAG: hypothetical protein Q3992_03920 [Bacteroides sp.]|nr:hypothetical protein [Bacteroides sp.]
MALIIKNKKGVVYDVPNDLKVDLEVTSPVFTNKGSQSVSVTLPPTKKNLQATGYLHRLDITELPKKDDAVTISDGVFRREAKQNITSANSREGITSNFGFDESILYYSWKGMKLSEIKNLPVRKFNSFDSLSNLANSVMRQETVDDFCIFPIQVSRTEVDKKILNEKLNAIKLVDGSYKLLTEQRTESYAVNGKRADIKVSQMYGVTPFIRVGVLLELIFTSFDFRLLENPFKTDRQLKNMVVLNNVADALVFRNIDYKLMMPDCTVDELLDALYCRTGAKVFIDGNSRTARIKLLRDILMSEPELDITNMRTKEFVANFGNRRQIKLSAKTSFEGAKPAIDNFDDFYSQYKGIINEITESSESNFIPSDIYMQYQNATGQYWRNNYNGDATELVSSDFFPWNKKSKGYDEEDVNSIDECLPMKFVDGHLLPQYLVGSVHVNTTLRITQQIEKDSDKDKKNTPLCFCFSMGTDVDNDHNKYYFGSSLCRNGRGQYHNGFDYSLTFCGVDGAYNRFFKEYDAVLRYSGISYEGEIKFNRLTLSKIDISKPISVESQTVLIENLKYTLPLSEQSTAKIKLKSMRLLSATEQQEELVPKFKKQTATWEFFSTYEDEKKKALAKMNEDISANYPSSFNLDNYTTSPDVNSFNSDEEFLKSLIPPTEEQVLIGEEHTDSHNAVLMYLLEGPNSTNAVNTITFTYRSGVRAVPLK